MTSAAAIASAGVQSADEVRRHAAPLICYSGVRGEANRELRRFLYKNVYYHPRVAEVNERACEMLSDSSVPEMMLCRRSSSGAT